MARALGEWVGGVGGPCSSSPQPRLHPSRRGGRDICGVGADQTDQRMLLHSFPLPPCLCPPSSHAASTSLPTSAGYLYAKIRPRLITPPAPPPALSRPPRPDPAVCQRPHRGPQRVMCRMGASAGSLSNGKVRRRLGPPPSESRPCSRAVALAIRAPARQAHSALLLRRTAWPSLRDLSSSACAQRSCGAGGGWRLSPLYHDVNMRGQQEQPRPRGPSDRPPKADWRAEGTGVGPGGAQRDVPARRAADQPPPRSVQESPEPSRFVAIAAIGEPSQSQSRSRFFGLFYSRETKTAFRVKQ